MVRPTILPYTTRLPIALLAVQCCVGRVVVLPSMMCRTLLSVVFIALCVYMCCVLQHTGGVANITVFQTTYDIVHPSHWYMLIRSAHGATDFQSHYVVSLCHANACCQHSIRMVMHVSARLSTHGYSQIT